MEERIINKVNQKLNRIATLLLILCIMTAAAGESGILPLGIVPEAYIYNVQITACLLTVICVPVALKLLSWQNIRGCIRNNPTEYYVWATKRLLLIYVPMLLNILLHYLLMDMSPFYLSLICAVAVLYVWPSKARMMQEIKEKNNDEE